MGRRKKIRKGKGSRERKEQNIRGRGRKKVQKGQQGKEEGRRGQ
jgi:hypothetical protein